MATPARATATTVHQEGSQFGSTQVSGGQLLQGNFVGLTINPIAPARAGYVGTFSHSSIKPVKAYVQRPRLSERIRAQLNATEGDEEDDTKMLVVWGLGGAGKTQVVLDYVRRHRNEYKAMFWVEAGRKESIERDFMNIYQLLFDVRMSAGQEVFKADDAILRVKNWFYSRRDRSLLVFDGADSIDNEEDSDYIDLKHFMPDAPLVHIIVTTRSRTAKDITTLDGVQVGEMDEAQATESFYVSSQLKNHRQEIDDEVKCIVKELGYLALAVALAGTYVSRTPRLLSDVRRYLPEYSQRRKELLSRKPQRLIHQYSESILTTWETSFLAVYNQCSEASNLLTLLAFLSFDDISLGLFGEDSERREAQSLEDEKPHIGWRSLISPRENLDVYKIEECFRVLETYSLAQWKDDQNSYSIHKLVHAWGHDRLSTEEQGDFSLAAFQLIQEAISKCSEEPRDKLRLVPHVMANFATLVNAIGGPKYRTEAILDQLGGIGVFVTDIGRWSEGRIIQEFIAKEWNKIRGKDHPSTISAINNLANTFRDQGQLDEAAAMSKEVLEKRRRILGEEHPDTISAMNNLATMFEYQGQFDKAAAMFKEVLEKRRRILGEEHLDTIPAISNLAATLKDQGQLDRAAAMFKEVLEKMRRILGEEHLGTISAMNNLAITLRDQGQLNKAVAAIIKEILKKRTRFLGEEHRDTISAISSFATTLGGQGQFDKVAAMLKEVLEKRRRILGEEHPDTILAMGNLADTLRDQGQLNEAVEMMEEVVQKMKRILGDEHPNTKVAIRNLAIHFHKRSGGVG